MILEMESVLKGTRMVRIEDSSQKERPMVLEYTTGTMAKCMKETGKMDKKVVLVSGRERTQSFMKENGKTEKLMVKEHTNGTMVIPTLETGKSV